MEEKILQTRKNGMAVLLGILLGYLLDTLVTKKYGGHTECQELGLPVTASGLALPCGATGRWMADAE